VNHRIVSGVIVIVLLLFGAAASIFALSMLPPRSASAQASIRPAPIPHQGEGYTACGSCHGPGMTAIRMPATHREFPPSACPTCHPTTSLPKLLP